MNQQDNREANRTESIDDLPLSSEQAELTKAGDGRRESQAPPVSEIVVTKMSD